MLPNTYTSQSLTYLPEKPVSGATKQEKLLQSCCQILGWLASANFPVHLHSIFSFTMEMAFYFVTMFFFFSTVALTHFGKQHGCNINKRYCWLCTYIKVALYRKVQIQGDLENSAPRKKQDTRYLFWNLTRNPKNPIPQSSIHILYKKQCCVKSRHMWKHWLDHGLAMSVVTAPQR